MKKHRGYFLTLLLFTKLALAQEADSTIKYPKFQLHGYIKAMPSVYFNEDPNSILTGNLIHNRLNFRADIIKRLHFRAEVRNRLFYGEQVKLLQGFGDVVDFDPGLVDLSFNLYDTTAIVLNSTIDRLLISYSGEKLEATVGRQRINWGVNLVWNPNDIFNAFNYLDFDYEERPGTDAVRIQFTPKTKHTFDLAVKIADSLNQEVAALMYKTNIKKYDWQSFAGVYFKDLVVGTGWAGNIFKTGFKGEATYFHPYDKMQDSTGVLAASVSFDRSFKNDYFAMASYLYNSNEQDQFPFIINRITGTGVSAKNLMPFESSFFAQGSKTFNSLVNISLAAIYSPKNLSLILLPTLNVSMATNWEMTLVGQSYFDNSMGPYQAIGNAVFMRVRWSF